MRQLKAVKKQEMPSIETEIAVLNECVEALARLNNYKAELRVLRYLMERLKGDNKRKYGDDE